MYFIKYYYTIFQILLKHLFSSQDFLLFFFSLIGFSFKMVQLTISFLRIKWIYLKFVYNT